MTVAFREPSVLVSEMVQFWSESEPEALYCGNVKMSGIVSTKMCHWNTTQGIVDNQLYELAYLVFSKLGLKTFPPVLVALAPLHNLRVRTIPPFYTHSLLCPLGSVHMSVALCNKLVLIMLHTSIFWSSYCR